MQNVHVESGFYISFTGVAGALCARECRVDVYYFIKSVFHPNLFKQNMSVKLTRSKINISFM